MSLRQSGKIRDFLQIYPKYKHKFALFRNLIHEFTDTLYQNYISCYIYKEPTKSIKQITEKFREHVIQLHNLYINSLRMRGEYISNKVVIQYVNNLAPSVLFFYLKCNFLQK